jgi:hypothetical protein
VVTPPAASGAESFAWQYLVRVKAKEFESARQKCSPINTNVDCYLFKVLRRRRVGRVGSERPTGYLARSGTRYSYSDGDWNIRTLNGTTSFDSNHRNNERGRTRYLPSSCHVGLDGRDLNPFDANSVGYGAGVQRTCRPFALEGRPVGNRVV